MNGYIKYFDNGGKNMSFKIEDESVYLKDTKIWNKIKDILNLRFHSQLMYDDKYIKTKVKTFNNSQVMKFLKKEFIVFVFQQFVLILF